jgi:hypothetical protein
VPFEIDREPLSIVQCARRSIPINKNHTISLVRFHKKNLAFLRLMPALLLKNCLVCNKPSRICNDFARFYKNEECEMLCSFCSPLCNSHLIGIDYTQNRARLIVSQLKRKHLMPKSVSMKIESKILTATLINSALLP